jgi:hypothetical protein
MRQVACPTGTQGASFKTRREEIMHAVKNGKRSTHVAEEPFSILRTSALFVRVETRLDLDPRRRVERWKAVSVAFYLLITWITPMVLSSLQPARPGAITFTEDFETHLRSFVAIPLLIFAECKVDPEVRYIVRSLASPRRCHEPEKVRALARRLRPWVTHPLVGIALFAIALFLVPQWVRQHASGHDTWIFQIDEGRPTLTAAGTWQAYVVVPIYVVLLLRWTWRWIILAVLFARCAPLLRPVISHGDRCGGFSFVSHAPARFAWVIAGASSLVSARWLFEVVREGVPAHAFTKQALAVLILSVMVAFFPLLGFTFHFARDKRSALRRYRAVVEGHARNVERSWYQLPPRVSSSSARQSVPAASSMQPSISASLSSTDVGCSTRSYRTRQTSGLPGATIGTRTSAC